MYKATSFIYGQPILNDKEININSPIDGSIVGTIPVLSEDQVLDAFKSAEEAFHKWKNVDYKTRTKYVLKFAEKLKEHAVILQQITHLEIGKDLVSVHNEIMRSVDYIVETVHAYSDMVEKPEEYNYENNVLIPKDIIATYIRVPHGVALTISPFNFPINLMITKIIPAILTGNTVVHKSSLNGSLTGWYIAKLFNDLEIDNFLITPGVFNYVTGKGSEIGKLFLKSEKVNVFSFTGSTEVGQKMANSLPQIPMQLEMGGHNPAVIFKDANMDLAIREIMKGSFGFSGQRCTSIKKVFVEKKVYEEFVNAFKLKLKGFKLKEPLIDKSIVNSLKECYEEALNKGAKLISDPLEIKDNFVTPVVFTDVNKDMQIFKDELFAPIIFVSPFSEINELEEMCNDSRYGLQASIFTEDIELASQISLKLDFGRVNINFAPSRSPDILPFSGIKDSGFEVQGIRNSLFFFTRFKGIVLRKQAEEE